MRNTRIPPLPPPKSHAAFSGLLSPIHTYTDKHTHAHTQHANTHRYTHIHRQHTQHTRIRPRQEAGRGPARSQLASTACCPCSSSITWAAAAAATAGACIREWRAAQWRNWCWSCRLNSRAQCRCLCVFECVCVCVCVCVRVCVCLCVCVYKDHRPLLTQALSNLFIKVWPGVHGTLC